jgi:t-SNARE complex subunit (syntaxin)
MSEKVRVEKTLNNLKKLFPNTEEGIKKAEDLYDKMEADLNNFKQNLK